MFTRLQVKQWLKSSLGYDRTREDGNLTDTMIHEAINDAIKQIAYDCNLLPQQKRFPLVANQWEYSMPEELYRIRSVYHIDSDGTKVPLDYMSLEQFMDWRDTEDDTAEDPTYFTYPVFQGRVYSLYAQAPPVYDYVPKSYVTTQTIRTVVDSGINFGKTLDGRKISPGDIVHNITDDSYGYVEVLDTDTNRTTGTATGNTSSTILEDTTKNFVTLGVAVGDIIATPSSGVVTSYAFVTAVATTQLTYSDIKGSATTFASGNTYKVGIARKVRLSESTPHPGLREGTNNYFSVGSAKATMTGTTFTNTRCTGSSPSGAEVGDIAVASGGSHGKITAVGSTYVDVDMWIGGVPVAAETVTIKACDQYQIESRHKTERVMWIGPTPSESATLGSENIMVLYNQIANLPDSDDDYIELPEQYLTPFRQAVMWHAMELTGSLDPEGVSRLKYYYEVTVKDYKGDIWKPPSGKNLTVWGNRTNRTKVRGHRDQTRSGAIFDLDF